MTRQLPHNASQDAAFRNRNNHQHENHSLLWRFIAAVGVTGLLTVIGVSGYSASISFAQKLDELQPPKSAVVQRVARIEPPSDNLEPMIDTQPTAPAAETVLPPLQSPFYQPASVPKQRLEIKKIPLSAVTPTTSQEIIKPKAVPDEIVPAVESPLPVPEELPAAAPSGY